MQTIPIPAPVLEASASSPHCPAPATTLARRVSHWLDSTSAFFTALGGRPVTLRLALRVNLVTACVVLTAFAIEAAPLAAATSLATAVWLTYRFNHSHTTRKGTKS